jgi:predicted lipoprotein with Yx(FWY)xxD motif
MRRPLPLITSLTIGGLLAGACAGGATPAAPAASVAAPPSAAASVEPSASASAEPSASVEASGSGATGDATIAIGTTDLGDVVVDAEGMTLYIFTDDVDGESTCYDQCASAWPPLMVEGEPTPGEGIEETDLATVERTDGTQQVTYFGKPLYYFASDTAPGDTTGQGVGDKWYVIGADGTEIR